MSVALVVTSYERTYRAVLSPGYFPRVVADNARSFDEVVALVNNVQSPDDAARRGARLVAAGEIDRIVFVAQHIDDALRTVRMTRRRLGARPYLLDYGLVMPHVVESDWLLGWDAEVRLERAVNWVDPSIAVMEQDDRIFSASTAWPTRIGVGDTLPAETVERLGPWHLNWNFSDQLFLVRRAALAAPIYRSLAPAAWVRHRDHPYTFEARIEAYQRSHRLFRATFSQVRYQHADLLEVTQRLGRTRREKVEGRLLRSAGRLLEAAAPPGPRWREFTRT